MLTALIFLMILVGVTVSWYQIYQMHFNINTYDSVKLTGQKNRQFEKLSVNEKRAVENQDTSLLDEAAVDIFGNDFNVAALRIAFSKEGQETYGVPLLRRKRGLVLNSSSEKATGRVSARHTPGFKTGLPSINLRSFFMVAVIANGGLIQLLAAMSIYTIHYEVSVSMLAWINQPVMIMSTIFFIVLLNYLISKIDAYLHDLYQVEKLNRLAPLFK